MSEHKKFKLLGGRTVKDPPSIAYQPSPSNFIYTVFEIHPIWLEESNDRNDANISTFYDYAERMVEVLNEEYGQ